MQDKAITGICHLCGKIKKKLTYEHVPPRKAFNSIKKNFFIPEKILLKESEQNISRGNLNKLV